MKINPNKFVIVYRNIKKHPKDNKDYLAVTGIIGKSNSYVPEDLGGNYFITTCTFTNPYKNTVIVNNEEEGSKIIKENLDSLNRKYAIDGNIHDALKCMKICDVKFHKDLVREYAALNRAKKSLIETVKKAKEEKKLKSLTQAQIDKNIDTLLKAAEERKNFWNTIHEPKLYSIKKEPPFELKQFGGVGDTSHKAWKNKCTVNKDILIKDKKTGLYLRVPENGNCYLTDKKDCTLFKNSNQSHYIMNNIESRKYLECYHNMDLVEVYLSDDKPIIRNKPLCDNIPIIHEKSIDDIIDSFNCKSTTKVASKPQKGKLKR